MTVIRRALQLLGLRSITAQHTEAEGLLLAKYAQGRETLVEIGVAEGGSALVLREKADPAAIIYLIDPYSPGRIPGFNSHKFIARKHLNKSSNASVVWIEDFSFNVAKTWNKPIDFLFIDASHDYKDVLKDWTDWKPFIPEGGIVAFHDAFDPNWGPGKLVQETFRNSENPEWKLVDEIDSLVIVERSKN